MQPDLTSRPVRELSDDDAAAILDVAVLCDVAEIGEVDTDLEDILRDLHAPHARWLGVDGDAGLDAYAWIAHLPGHVALDADVRVRPGSDLTVGPELLALVRSAGRGIDRTRPLHTFVHVEDAPRRKWFAAAGAEPVRHFWRMEVEHGSPPAEPTLPAGAHIRPVEDEETDKRALAAVVHASFADHFGHDTTETPSYEEFVERTHTVSGFDLRLWWIAHVDGQPAAALIGRELPGLGFVNTLGTLRQFRGRGLARALLLTAFREFFGRRLPRVVLGVDATSPTGAVALYESVGMRAAHSWTVYETPPL